MMWELSQNTGRLTDYVFGGLQRYLEEFEGASLESGREGDDIKSRDTGIFGLHLVGYDRGEVAEQSLKTVHGQIVWSALGVGLGLSGVRALCGRDHRGAQFLRCNLVLVVKQKGCQILAHVPLHVVSQHAEKDMSADAIGLAMVDRAHVQVYSFQAAKGSLHTRQALVVAHRLLTGQRFGGDVGANDINAI